MAAWKKKFERWKSASSPVDVEEVEALLPRIFGERLREAEGSSHRWHIDVTEIVGEVGFVLPVLPIAVRKGQKVLPVYLQLYLQRAYEAAELLGLYPPEAENEKEKKHEQDA